MKRSVPIVFILIIAAAVAFFWVRIDTALTRKYHPIEYGEYVEKTADEYAVPRELVYAVIKTESKFRSDAVSATGAIGLMQLMPDTFTWLCEKNSDSNNNPDLLYTPEVNIRYGVMYLSMLYTDFGSWETALAAYNAGPNKVRNWLKNSDYSDGERLVNIPYEETENYVKKVLNAREAYRELYFSSNK